MHPTYLFLLPVFSLVLATRIWQRTAGDRRRRLRELGTSAIGAVAVVGPLVWLTSGRSAIEWTYETYHFGPGNWPLYFAYFERMLLGFCEWGPAEPSRAVNVAFWAVVLGVLALGLPALIRRRQWERLALLAGLAISLVGMHLVTGPDILRPYLVRYGLYLVSPTIVAFACLVRALVPAPGGRLRSGLRLGQSLGVLRARLGVAHLREGQFLRLLHPAVAGPGGLLDPPDRGEGPEAVGRRDHRRRRGRRRRGGATGSCSPRTGGRYRPLQFYLSDRPELEPGSLEFFVPQHRDLLIRKHLEAGGYVVGTVGQDVIGRVESAFPAEELKHWHVFSPPYACLAVYRLKRDNEVREPEPIAVLTPNGVDADQVLR